jgi:RimJ/RimL family protein N-acetyltransferase
MHILQTPRLLLRWFGPGDARFILKLLNDPDWIRNIGRRNVHTPAEARRWIESRLVAGYGRQGFGFWAMVRRSDRRVVGMCGLIRRDALPHPDIGYALLPRYRGSGYAREAAAATLRYAQDVLGLEEVWGITAPDNAISGRVLTTIGLQDQGVRHFETDWGDSRVYTWRAPRDPAVGDAQRIDALAARFFRAFCNDGDAPPTMAALPHYFLPSAVVSIGAPDGSLVTTDLHGFIGPRAELLLDGRLVAFREWEEESRTEIAGPIAQRWIRYARQGTLDGRPFEGRGTKTMQLVRTPDGWKIAALAWKDDDPATRRGTPPSWTAQAAQAAQAARAAPATSSRPVLRRVK